LKYFRNGVTILWVKFSPTRPIHAEYMFFLTVLRALT